MQYTEIFIVVKKENFQLKFFAFFLFFGSKLVGTHMYPQSMFWSNKKKNRYTCAYEYPQEYPQSIFWSNDEKIGILCIPQFCYIKVGFEGVHISRTCFPDVFI